VRACVCVCVCVNVCTPMVLSRGVHRGTRPVLTGYFIGVLTQYSDGTQPGYSPSTYRVLSRGTHPVLTGYSAGGSHPVPTLEAEPKAPSFADAVAVRLTPLAVGFGNGLSGNRPKWESA
jgi:hypothetical protein